MARWARSALAMAFTVWVGCSGSGGHDDPPPCGNLLGGASLCEPPPDTTRPTVRSRYPASGVLVDGLDASPIVVVFDEPLDPATVNISSVRVYDDGLLLPSAVSLSPDGAMISIVPVVPVAPGTIFVELTPALTDLAGNAFAGEAAPWTFQLRRRAPSGAMTVWDDAGPNPTPSVALDATGAEVIGLGGFDQVVRHQGHVWEPLQPPSFSLSARVVADDDGGIWMADDDGENIQVSRWSEAGWSAFDQLTSGAGYPWDLFFVPRAQDPLVVFNACKYVDARCTVTLQVRARKGPGSWASWGAVDEELLFLDVARAPDGEAFVIGSLRGGGARVYHLTSSGPVPLPALDHGGYGDGTTAIAVGPDDLPIVAVPVPGVGVQVSKWNGTSWSPIGQPQHVVASPAFMVTALAVDAAGAPVLAWAENAGSEPSRLHRSAWSAALGEWLVNPDALNADVTHDVYDVALTVHGERIVWAEATGETRLDVDGQPYALYRFMLLYF